MHSQKNPSKDNENQSKEANIVSDAYLRPDHSLKDGVQLIWTEAVGVKAVEKVLDPEDAESPQVLQWTDAACTQLQKTGNEVRTAFY